MGRPERSSEVVGDSDDKAIELREKIRRNTLALRAMRAIWALLALTFASLLTVGISTGNSTLTQSSGFAVVAGFLYIFPFSDIYYSTRDEQLALLSQLRRRIAELASQSTRSDAAAIHRTNYRASIPDRIELYRLSARRLRRSNNLMQTIVIVGSLSATALVSVANVLPIAQLAGIAATLLVGISATASTYFKFKERSLNHQEYADTLETELRSADMRIDEYSGLGDSEALETLVSRAERHRRQHNIQERQLDQAADVTLPNI